MTNQLTERELELKVIQVFQQFKSEHDTENKTRDLEAIRAMQHLITQYGDQRELATLEAVHSSGSTWEDWNEGVRYEVEKRITELKVEEVKDGSIPDL